MRAAIFSRCVSIFNFCTLLYLLIFNYKRNYFILLTISAIWVKLYHKFSADSARQHNHTVFINRQNFINFIFMVNRTFLSAHIPRKLLALMQTSVQIVSLLLKPQPQLCEHTYNFSIPHSMFHFYHLFSLILRQLSLISPTFIWLG